MSKKENTHQMFDDELENIEKTDDPVQEKVQEESVSVPEGNVLRLPSCGRLGYESSVSYRDLMVKDEETLSSATGDTYTKTLSGVLKSVMNDCEFFERMTVHDRDYALVWIWANNYSKHKELEMNCRSCGANSDHKVNLLELPFSEVNPDIKHPMEIPVKKTGHPIKVRLQTIADEMFAEEFLQKVKESKEFGDIKFDQVLLYRSIDIGVELPFENKIRWVRENLSAKELGLVRKYHIYFRYGLEHTIELKCPSCGEVTKTHIPFQLNDVFSPTVSDGFEDLL